MEKKYISLVLAVLVITNIFIYSLIKKDSFSTLDFLDVGQGDASLLSFKNSGRILIDSGPGKNILKSLFEVLGFFDRKIDVLIVTHADWDHFGGMKYIVERNSPRVLIYNGILDKNRNFRNLLKLAKEKDIILISFLAGDKIRVGDGFIETLWPKNISDESGNKESLVMKANIEDKSILFLGDAENEDLLGLSDLKADILKVSHHGSKTGSSQDLIERIKPEMALIGVGKENSYGHPHKEVLSWLEYFGAEIMRTDELGSIRVVFGG